MAGDEDEPLCQTAQFSVVTLRNLLARTTTDEGTPVAQVFADPPTVGRPPSEGEMGVLSKGAPVLVFPEEPAPPVVAPPPPPPPLPVVVESAPPRPAPRLRASAQPGTDLTLAGFLQRRFLALTLLALTVMSQPWWWNLGDVRPHGFLVAGATQGAARAMDR
jgi:hypothetical protein